MFREKVTDVFFDLDHTLWDFEKNSALTFEKIFGESGLAVPMADFLEIYVPLNHALWKRFREGKISKENLRYVRLRRTFNKLGMRIDDAQVHRLSDEYIANLSSFDHLFPNAISTLQYLQGRYRLHIITNGFGEVQGKKINNSGLGPYFQTIVHSEMAGAKKPNPRIFQLALETAGTTPERSLMIGDNLEADIMGAKVMGFHVLHFNSNNEPHHQICGIITDLGEIKSYL